MKKVSSLLLLVVALSTGCLHYKKTYHSLDPTGMTNALVVISYTSFLVNSKARGLNSVTQVGDFKSDVSAAGFDTTGDAESLKAISEGATKAALEFATGIKKP